MKNTTKPEPTWRDVKAKLEDYDRAGLLKLLKDLYELNGANHAFLNARLSLGAAPLTPYKNTISRWIAPDVTKGQDISVVKAKRAISDYKKAVGHPRGVAELSVFYCEEAVGLLSWGGMDDESYHAALVRMFDEALTAICGLPETERARFLERREKAPDNIVYDGSRKRFLATPEFQPRFLKPNPDRYLAQLEAIADRVITLQETWIGAAPATEVMPIPRRKVDAAILKGLLTAVRSNRSIDIQHRSMNRERPETMWRRITPHAFGHDGFRWHVRAFCHIDGIFKDFVLSRCLAVGAHHLPGAEPGQDSDWFTFLDVVLEPNPELSERDRRTIAHDYDMPDGRVTVQVRRALLYYFKKRLRLDAAKTIGDPAVAPLAVVNYDEFMSAIPTMKPDSDLLT